MRIGVSHPRPRLHLQRSHVGLKCVSYVQQKMPARMQGPSPSLASSRRGLNHSYTALGPGAGSGPEQRFCEQGDSLTCCPLGHTAGSKRRARCGPAHRGQSGAWRALGCPTLQRLPCPTPGSLSPSGSERSCACVPGALDTEAPGDSSRVCDWPSLPHIISRTAPAGARNWLSLLVGRSNFHLSRLRRREEETLLPEGPSTALLSQLCPKGIGCPSPSPTGQTGAGRHSWP